MSNRNTYKMELNEEIESSEKSGPEGKFSLINDDITITTQNKPKSEIFEMIRKISITNPPITQQQINNQDQLSESDSKLLKPGSKIKPEVNKTDIENLSERLYGITPKNIKELKSYDDRNFLIDVDASIKNPILTNTWSHGYVLKVLNSLDSEKVQFIEAQTEIMLHLRENGLTCSNPVKNVYGKYYSVENLNGKNHVVRLLEYIPGEMFHQIDKTKHIYYQCGEYIANMDRILKRFHHDAYKNHKSIWQLEAVPKLKDFLFVLQDHGRKEIVEQVIEAFEKKVLKNFDQYESGVIHGDFNEQNILVEIPKGLKDYHIIGVIDFGDTHIAPLIFELAIAMTYMMLEEKDLATGGLVIAGYSSIRVISLMEKEILKECVAARLCQSLVLGAYTHSLDPGNDYVLTTQEAGWNLLESLWKENLNKIDEIWDNTADEYLKQSFK
ncbi:hydroxylysine kinase [Condylostylus longicornis]|uniref:hydroxylysine kinase n=1 Tax=Condylostylus longicornis TaxID=2530218 RepID=UPI00244DFD3C|nr:hydroxylysine kinase [Condylostylus longicornis]